MIPAVGVANSIYADSGFDPVKTIEWAGKYRFNPVQIYLNKRLCSQRHRLNEIRTAAVAYQRELIIHAPGKALFCRDDRDAVFKAVKIIMSEEVAWSGCFCLIWHIQPDRSPEDHLAIQERIFRHGFVSAPENFVCHKQNGSPVLGYEILEQLWKPKSVVPVLDLPRFFSEFDHAGLEYARKALSLPKIGTAGIIHVIDGMIPLNDRTHWCPVSSGICQWDEMTRIIKTLFPESIYIMEYEERENPIKSRNILLNRLSS